MISESWGNVVTWTSTGENGNEIITTRMNYTDGTVEIVATTTDSNGDVVVTTTIKNVDGTETIQVETTTLVADGKKTTITITEKDVVGAIISVSEKVTIVDWSNNFVSEISTITYSNGGKTIIEKNSDGVVIRLTTFDSDGSSTNTLTNPLTGKKTITERNSSGEVTKRVVEN